jgi:hypothetical protein
MVAQPNDEDQFADLGPHLVVACEPHKPLPVLVWLGPVLIAQLPSRESLTELNRHHVLQRLRLRLLAELRRPVAADAPPDLVEILGRLASTPSRRRPGPRR